MVAAVGSIRTKPVYFDNTVLFIFSRFNGYLDCQCTGPLIIHGDEGKPSAWLEPAPAAAHYGTFKF